MKITHLTLKNFLGHEHTDLDLSKVTSLAIVGVNGSGKSSLIDAIVWCLYGKINARGSKSDAVARFGCIETSVTLVWEQNDIKYSLTRVRNNEKNTQKLELLANDEPVSSRKKTEVESLITEIIKVPFELFQITNGLQQESKSFLDLKPTDRKTYLSQILQLDKYKTLQNLAKSKKTELIANKNNCLGQQQTVINLLSEYNQEFTEEPVINEKYQETIEKQKKVISFLKKAEEQQIEEKQKTFIEKEKYKNLLEVKKEQLQNLLEKITQLGPIEESDEYSSKIIVLQKDQEKITQQLFQLEKTFLTKRESIAALNNDLKNYKNIIESAKDLNPDVPCQSCFQNIPDEHIEKTVSFYKKLHDEKNSAIKEIESEILEIKNEKNKLDDQKNNLIKEEKDLKNVIDKINQKKILIDQVTNEKEKLTKEITLLSEKIIQNESSEIPEEILQKIKSAESLQRTLESELQLLNKKVNHFDTLKNLIEKYKLDLEKINVGLEDIESEILTYNLIIDACHPQKGIPAKIIENSLYPLEKIANDLLAYFPGDTKFNVYFQTLTEDGKETLELLVKSSATPHDRYYEQLSGGEKTRINLALRIALIRMICNIYNVENRTLIIDEGFHALSSDIRGTVFEILSSLLGVWFDKIFIVTHSPEISDLIPFKLELKKDTIKDKAVISYKNF